MCVYSKSTYSYNMAAQRSIKEVKKENKKNQHTHTHKKTFTIQSEKHQKYSFQRNYVNLCSVQFNSIQFLSFLAIHAVAAFHFHTIHMYTHSTLHIHIFAQCVHVCEFLYFTTIVVLPLPLVMPFWSLVSRVC